MEKINQKLMLLALLPLSSTWAGNGFIAGQTQLSNGRAVDYVYDSASQNFGIDLNSMVNVKYITSPSIDVSKKDCEYWDDTITNLSSSLRDGAGTLAFLPKPKSDFAFKINFIDPYLNPSVSEAVSSHLKEQGFNALKIKNGTELIGLNASVILKWEDTALTKKGKNNLIADAEGRFNVSTETAQNGGVSFHVAWEGLNQYVACDLLRKSVRFIIVFNGENQMRYRSAQSISSTTLKQVWVRVSNQEPNQNEILSHASSLSYRNAQWAMAGAKLALAHHQVQSGGSPSLNTKTFFGFLDAFFEPTQVVVRKDFENDVLPRLMNAVSTEQKTTVAKFQGERTL